MWKHSAHCGVGPCVPSRPPARPPAQELHGSPAPRPSSSDPESSPVDADPSPVEPVEPVESKPAPIRLYWRPGCPFCALLRRRMRAHGVPCREIDIWQDPAGAAFVRSVTGGDETVPTVAVGARNLVNPSIRDVLATIATELPELDINRNDGPGLRTPRSWFSSGARRARPPSP